MHCELAVPQKLPISQKAMYLLNTKNQEPVEGIEKQELSFLCASLCPWQLQVARVVLLLLLPQ